MVFIWTCSQLYKKLLLYYITIKLVLFDKKGIVYYISEWMILYSPYLSLSIFM